MTFAGNYRLRALGSSQGSDASASVHSIFLREAAMESPAELNVDALDPRLWLKDGLRLDNENVDVAVDGLCSRQPFSSPASHVARPRAIA